MKTKIIISLLLITSALIYSFKISERMTSGEAAMSEPPQEEFILGALSNVFDNTMYNYLSDSLNFNMWHLYAGPVDNYGWTYDNGVRMPFDTLGGNTSYYGPYIRDRILQNSQNELMTLMTRPVVTYFAYGQRSDYQMEESTKVDPYYFFYTYNYSKVNVPWIIDIQDNSQYGSGEYVKRCLYDRDSPGSHSSLIVSGLKGNKEQANTYWDVPYLGDRFSNWYIMPRIRIDSAFANDPSKQETEVCRIIITNWDGDSLAQILKVKNFKPGPDSFYHGNYLEHYYPYLNDSISNLTIPASDWFNQNQPDPHGHDDGQIDFKVYWYDKCDMWIDRIRVENEPARQLMTEPFQPYLTQLKYEIEEIALAMKRSINTNYEPYKFYLEEFEMNHLPSIGHVNKMIRELTHDSMSLMVNYNYDLVRSFIPGRDRYEFTADMIKRYLIDSAKLREIFTECYGLEGWRQNDPLAGNNRESYNPPTLNHNDYDSLNGILVYRANSINYYEDWLQTKMQSGCNGYCKPITFNYIYKLSDEISRIGNVPFMYLLQAHSWWYKYHKLKEPTKEEISLQAYLAVAYGAKGIMYFAYNSHNNISFTDSSQWGRGLAEYSVNAPYTPRYLNAYGQEKWSFVGSLNKKIKDISPYLLSFENNSRKSFIYNLSEEFAEMSSSRFIKELKTYPVTEIHADSIPELSGLNSDSPGSTYLQASFFNKENDTGINKYFMIVNRRCSPFFNFGSTDSIGGRRFIAMKMNSSHLSGFNNWTITDLEKNSNFLTVNKYDTIYFYLGDFMPGEGKLFKLSPVMQEGGTLVTDEDCGGFEFDCKGEVNNNGNDVNLKPGTTINFTNSSARIIMTGGNFKSGITSSENTAPVYLQGKNGSLWKGLHFSECGDVEIERTYFENISPYPVDSTYAAELIDCEYININSSSFRAELDIKTGGILINYTSALRAEEVYINYNHFEMDAGELPAVSVVTSGYVTLPMIIEGNEFVSFTGNSSNAMLISGVEGGAIKNNRLTGYKNGIILIWSMMDIYGNSIDGDNEDSKGILSYASSNANLAPDGSIYTGGFNTISSEGENAKCIISDNSFLLLDNGFNTFDLKNYAPGDAYHLSGTISDEAYADPLDATLNCFKVSGTDTNAVHNMTWTNEEPVNYNFIEYYCGDNEQEGMMAFYLGNGMYDTLYSESSGSGGGKQNYLPRPTKGGVNSKAGELKSAAGGTNYLFRLKADELKDFNRVNDHQDVQIISVENMEDSVSINIRKRDYERVSELCHELLDDYIDSIESSVIVQKLYLAELRLDSTGERITDLKSYLELLILNNPEKELLVKQAFYLIQKCKVALGQYESAMDGFEQIINQNPYSYDGLIASWDYAAASLLLNNQSGSGGGISNDNPDDTSDDDPKNKKEKKTITKEDRKNINANVFNSSKSSRDRESAKIKTLETKATEGNATKTEKNELRTKRILSEIVKTKKPADIAEHIKNVSENIQMLFGSGNNNANKKEIKNIFPTEYHLSQNYPNPFNPETKIEFELPEDTKVTLIIYDILGREVKKLLNNEYRISGRYSESFSAINLPSGVYFYKLKAGDFVNTKRMVLIK